MTGDQQQWTSTEDQAPPPAPSGAESGGWSSTDDHTPDPRFSTASLGPDFQPDFETTVYAKAPPDAGFAQNYLLNQPASGMRSTGAWLDNIVAGVYGGLDAAAEHVARVTGTTRGGAFQWLHDQALKREQENQNQALALAGARTDLGSRIVRDVSSFATKVPAYALALRSTGGYVPGFATMGALQNLEQGPHATAEGFIEGAKQGAVAWVLGPAGRLVRLVGNAAVAYLQAKRAGADDDTAWENAGIAGVVGALPGKQPYPEWWTKPALRASEMVIPGRFKVDPFTSEQDLGSEELMNRLGIDRPYYMYGKTPFGEQLGASVTKSLGGGYLAKQIEIGKQKLIGAAQQQAAAIGPPATEAIAGAAVKAQIGDVLAKKKEELGQALSKEPSTPLEAGTAAQQRIATDLENTKQTIAAQVHPQTQTPESAGEATLGRGKQLIQQYQKQADQAYTNAWKALEHPGNWEAVPVQDKDGGLVHDENGNVVREKMALPIDLADEQTALSPILDEWERTMTPTKKSASVGLVALRELVNGKRWQSVKTVEQNIGMLKDAADTEDLPELRGKSEGLAAMALVRLQNKVDATMANAQYPGWDPASGTPSPALTNLQAGRKNTALKYDIRDRFKALGGKPLDEIEPVQAFGNMTWGRDSGIRKLRSIAEVAPDQMAQVGRAFIESGGDVSELGPETRKILFRTPEINQQLDQYQAAKTRFAPLLRQEPVAAFNQLTQPGGKRINLLSDVAKAAPEQVPAIARAFIDNDGNWGKLDPQTKLLLARDPELVHKLDAYYDLHQKYGDLHKMEPVAVYNLLTAPEGRRLEFLNDVAIHAPEQMPLVARAYFEGLLNNLTRKGDIRNVDSTINSFLDMDAHTKRILINNPGQVKDWEHLLFAIGRMMHNPNPSGSGFMMGINALKSRLTEGLAIMGGFGGGHAGGAEGALMGSGLGLVGGVGLEILSNAALARMMYNKAFIRMVTRGIEAQNRGDLPASRLAARTAADMLNKEPPEDPHGGPPTGGGTPSGPPPPTPTGGGAAVQPPGSTTSIRGVIPTRLTKLEDVEGPAGGEPPGEPAIPEDMFRDEVTPKSEWEKLKDLGKRFLKEEEGSLTLGNLRKADRAAGSEQSTRVPRAVKSTEDPLSNILTTGYESWKRDPEMMRKNVSAMLEYPNFHDLRDQVKSGALSIPDAAEHIISRIGENLQWLHDAMPAEFRDRARLWYDGAHKIARRWAGQYGATPEQVAGTMAVTSPGTDWFINAERARRMLEFWQDRGSKTWDPRMAKMWRDKISGAFPEDQAKQVYKQIRGKSFNDVQAISPTLAAAWFRLYDEAVNPREYPTLTPEGKSGGLARTGKGDPSQFNWSDFKQIAKGLSILQDGSKENIHQQLGNEHKVRNFYNNIINPDSPREHTTIDTHAVAAGLMRPLSQMSTEVGHNFGGAGSSSSSISGESGTYGLIKEAYRRTAAANGLLPRELQSITWEAIRSMFSRTFKGNPANVAYINSLWQDVSSGKITADAARRRALQYGGGFDRPTWFRGRWNPAIPKGAGLPRKPR